LRPWNDLENQVFEKIPDSSYCKINEDFPLPIQTAKLNPANNGFYQQFLNENYLSLSMGSENFKFKIRNINEDNIFKNEDEMYKLDTQIEMFEKCMTIVDEEIVNFDNNSKGYIFPLHRFKPLMYFWEKRYKDALMPILLHKPFKREVLTCLIQGIGGKLQELQNSKFDQMSTFEDIYRKNFIKSLDHRSFQYKDFIKKYTQK
jgi:histone deacetylase complex regulatory component SIN3